MPLDVIHSAAYREFRDQRKAEWAPSNRPCWICHQATIDWDGPRNAPDSFELHHPKSRKRYPHLALDPTNAVPTHCRCNRAAGQHDIQHAIGENTEEW